MWAAKRRPAHSRRRERRRAVGARLAAPQAVDLVCRQLPHDRPGLLDVPRDLRLQLLDAAEALLATQLLVQEDLDALAVELEVVAVEHVDLEDRVRLVLVEGGRRP